MPVIKVHCQTSQKTIVIINFEKRFQNFIAETMNWFLIQGGYKPLATGSIGTEFYGDVVCSLKTYMHRADYKRIGYDINIMRSLHG